MFAFSTLQFSYKKNKRVLCKIILQISFFKVYYQLAKNANQIYEVDFNVQYNPRSKSNLIRNLTFGYHFKKNWKSWALSSITSSPSLFASPSIYNNFNFLYWQNKDCGADETSLRVFPWLIWYIWEVQNRKIFENICEHP